MAQGEYIAPEKVENVYTKCRFVSQCFIYGKSMGFTLNINLLSYDLFPDGLICFVGDSFNSSLVAVVAVEPDVLRDWAVSEGIKVVG